MSNRTALAFCLLSALAGAQTMAVGSGTFVDISTTGGTAILGVTDDSMHTINTTIGNGLFPSGVVRITNNGACISNNTGTISCCSQAAIPASGVPTGFPPAGVGG